MSSHQSDYWVKCRDDCITSGCPSHQINLQANNTTDTLSYTKGGKVLFSMDFDELKQFIEEIYDMRYWVEVEKIFNELGGGQL
ncbi:MAG: hypothetical protein KBC44_03330 [Candidatus Pacebacteria bacterium]|nr:hypothetical protein [Candidatus Paceibacterota bacterium]